MSRRCIVCAAPMTAVDDWLARCPDCGQWASDLSPSFDDPAVADALDRQALAASSTDLRRRNLGRVLDAAGPAKRMLDVGAGYGLAMELAAERGAMCVGIEPEPSLAQACVDRGLNVHAGFFPDDLPEQPPFDLILFNHVLEHVRDPGAALLAARQRLTPGGRVVVHSPSASGTLIGVARALRAAGLPGPIERMWWRRFPSPLLHRFTPDGLARLAASRGLERVAAGRTDPLEVRGLWSRLGAARELRLPKQVALWTGLTALVPLLRVLPGDYFFLILRASESNR